MQTKIKNWLNAYAVAIGYTFGFLLGATALYFIFALCLWDVSFSSWHFIGRYLFVFLSGWNFGRYYTNLKSYLP